MTQQSRIRRIGWIAALAVCMMLYLMLHLKVHAVQSDVVRAERQIVALEQQKMLLETEFETRANQLQLASWNNVDFGYTSPSASQYLESERQLAEFGTPRAPGAPEPIRVADASGDAPAYPRLISPLTGMPVDEALLEPDVARAPLVAGRLTGGTTRIPLGAIVASAAE